MPWLYMLSRFHVGQKYLTRSREASQLKKLGTFWPRSTAHKYKKIANQQAHQVSKSYEHTPEEVRVPIPELEADPWKVKHRDFLNSISNVDLKAIKDQYKTSKFKTYCKPSKVSIGPLHHGITDFEEIEKLKPAYAKLFMDEIIIIDNHEFITDNDEKVEKIFKKFENKLKGEKKSIEDLYHDETVKNKFEEDALIRMMFLDGCFILYFIESYKNESIELTSEVKAQVQQDLFSVENQLPFQVLEVLLELTGLMSFGRYMIWDFIGYTYGIQIWKVYKLLRHAKPLHLLDLLWIILFNEKQIGIDEPQNKAKGERELFRNLPFMGSSEPAPNHPNHIKRHLFHGVKDLTLAGINFRPNATGSLRDINFSSFCICGSLTLPRITIEKSTKQMFMNLIEHEVRTNRVGFISYICFLDFLIDGAEDVKELRSAKIFFNFLGDDQKVADLFNEMGNEIIGADLLQKDNDTYKEVKDRMVHYLRNERTVKIASCVAEVKRDHFKSPWKAIAVLAATLMICLTIVQTYFAAYPPSK